MGFSSFMTQDTQESIPNVYTAKEKFPVYLWMPRNPEPMVIQSYDGYGRFDGQDYFELVAEANGLTEADVPFTDALRNDPDEWLRLHGIRMYSAVIDGEGEVDPEWEFPQLTRNNVQPTDYSRPPEPCPYQGLLPGTNTRNQRNNDAFKKYCGDN